MLCELQTETCRVPLIGFIFVLLRAQVCQPHEMKCTHLCRRTLPERVELAGTLPGYCMFALNCLTFTL